MYPDNMFGPHIGNLQVSLQFRTSGPMIPNDPKKSTIKGKVDYRFTEHNFIQEATKIVKEAKNKAVDLAPKGLNAYWVNSVSGSQTRSGRQVSLWRRNFKQGIALGKGAGSGKPGELKASIGSAIYKPGSPSQGGGLRKTFIGVVYSTSPHASFVERGTASYTTPRGSTRRVSARPPRPFIGPALAQQHNDINDLAKLTGIMAARYFNGTLSKERERSVFRQPSKGGGHDGSKYLATDGPRFGFSEKDLNIGMITG